jgi:gas vesicle protein
MCFSQDKTENCEQAIAVGIGLILWCLYRSPALPLGINIGINFWVALPKNQFKLYISVEWYRSMADKNRGTFLGGVVVGAAVGAVAGLLAAPRKGRDSRKILSKTVAAVPQMAEDISSSIQLQVDRLGSAAGDRWHDTLDRLATAISAGIVASQSVRELNTANSPKSTTREVDE